VAHQNAPTLCVGWHGVEPPAAPVSPLYDRPPAPARGVDLAAEHHRWRLAVEADQRAIDRQHYAAVPVWYPIVKGGEHLVLPVYGGSPTTWDNLIAGLVIAANEGGFDRVRVANLVQWDLWRSLRRIARTAKSLSVRFEAISPRGSTLDLFATPSVDDLVALVVDLLRIDTQAVGRREAARDKQELLEVARLLRPPVDLGRLSEAVAVALGANPPPTTGLAAVEVRDLRDHRTNVVAQQPDVSTRLSNLQADLRELLLYRRDTKSPALKLGSGPERVRTLEIGAGATHERELARDLIARSVARMFATPGITRDLVVIAGAELIPADVLNDLTATAQRLAKQLVLLFSEDSPDGQRLLGYAGSGFAIFLRLANPALAEAAASFLGRQYKFVVNGITLTQGENRDWNDSLTHTDTSGRSTGMGGGSFNFGRNFGTSVARSLAAGRGVNTAKAVAQQRVHEYVIEPEQFQQLEDHRMLVVADGAVTLASSDFAIRKDPGRSIHPFVAP
jgi:hypothetical protein